MQDTELYATVLGIAPPWQVSTASLDADARIAEIVVTFDGPEICPVCDDPARTHDTPSRRWQHLDFFGYQFFITAQVPRMECVLHGINPVPDLWSGLTWYPLAP